MDVSLIQLLVVVSLCRHSETQDKVTKLDWTSSNLTRQTGQCVVFPRRPVYHSAWDLNCTGCHHDPAMLIHTVTKCNTHVRNRPQVVIDKFIALCTTF